MRLRLFHVAMVALLLSGCGSLTDGRKAERLDASLSHYEAALRWGYYDSAFSLQDPTQLATPPPDMSNVRLTSYEVAQPPILERDDIAQQVVRIEYVRQDEQRVQVILDRQRWRYDPDREAWWLASPLPSFR